MDPISRSSGSVTAPPPRLKILTVGDGDLTLSLALARAYGGDQVDITATTLVSNHEELCRTYHNAAVVVAELKERKVAIVFGVDATQLTSYPALLPQQGVTRRSQDATRNMDINLGHNTDEKNSTTGSSWDLILFHHPHLGSMTSQPVPKEATATTTVNDTRTNEQYHAHRHYVLLAHYLASAKAMLCRSTAEGRIHICLAHDQPQTWQLELAAQRQGLKLCYATSTVEPFHSILRRLKIPIGPLPQQKGFKSLQWRWKRTTGPSTSYLMANHDSGDRPTIPSHFAAPRRYRNGKLGSKHSLGKFGYRHRRTHGDIFEGNEIDTDVTGSQHFFFMLNDKHGTNDNLNYEAADETCSCSICGSSFGANAALQRHEEAPALPDPPIVSNRRQLAYSDPRTLNDSAEGTTTKGENVGSSSPSSNGVDNSADAATDSNIVTSHQWTVREEHSGKRLRWFLQHWAMSGRTRKQCTVLVVKGFVLLNGVVTNDTGRVLRASDEVTLAVPSGENELSSADDAVASTVAVHTNPEIEIVGRYTPLGQIGAAYLVVIKPVGMRTKGDFAQLTLEQTVSRQTGKRFISLSRMDRCCGGLCVMEQQKPENKRRATADDADDTETVVVVYEFFVLVHGHVPAAWDADGGVKVPVPWQHVRNWRSGRHATAEDNGPPDVCNQGESSAVTDEHVNSHSDDFMTISCATRTSAIGRVVDHKVAPALSTLKVATTCAAAGLIRAICYYLRQQGHGVVGDRLCQKDYAALPRSIRNRIKTKLCIGCYRVDVTKVTHLPSSNYDNGRRRMSHNISTRTGGASTAISTCSNLSHVTSEIIMSETIPAPGRLSALYWQEHWEQGSIAPKSEPTTPSALH